MRVMTKYRENRVTVALTTTVGAGNFMFEGMVANISRNGLKVTDLPMRFNPDEKKISTIIATPQGNFRMDVRTTWVRDAGYSKDVGFEILSFGDKWIQLLDRLDPVERRGERVTNWVSRVQ
jgi:hypothetical protein